MAANKLFMQLLILISIFKICRADDPDCVYTVYVSTGSVANSGTNSKITLTFYDAAQYGIRIFNLESWGGLMGPGYNYFEQGNLDIFSGRGPCLTGPICGMNLTSDGTGSAQRWFSNYVEVTSTGVHKQPSQRQFMVEEWLGTDTPSRLSAIRNLCSPNAKKNSMKSSALSRVTEV